MSFGFEAASPELRPAIPDHETAKPNGNGSHPGPERGQGMMLRRTYRTVAADCGVDEMLAHFLMGHAPSRISQRYVARMILSSGPAIRAAQKTISRRIVALLGLRYD
jgi:hypothetical protein